MTKISAEQLPVILNQRDHTVSNGNKGRLPAMDKAPFVSIGHLASVQPRSVQKHSLQKIKGGIGTTAVR